MMIDHSAAFDRVDHDLFSGKASAVWPVRILNVVSWFRSYHSGRSWIVCVDGSLSHPLELDGVPQGSILGPLLYILFTKYIPDLVHYHQVSFQETYFCQSC